ncbi:MULTISPECIES: DinB family protein [Roseivirga]|uniref:DinB-like domain-containing protein n=1 Tax=Roseivirga thermotolerans TaxID=1758176 RepID=A0ABQ3I9Q2_9BACT|nr:MULTISPECIES: DinB family protein [Roseivirga]MEC7754609.1 DinB family protein [Bacteroidota bacterium]GHE74649.1 hypothetical protein GCM10011340_34210 [Roseivirga thermotolerans]|tara:strand:- start:3036 stop:3599 length:564 start_codon:yes stop_codon:yes gene_type:complete
MKVRSEDFVNQSIHRLNDILSHVEALTQDLSYEELNTQEAAGKWSILQCLKHLSLANGIYVENIEKAFKKYPQQKDEVFSGHWKGNWFTSMITPKESGEIKNTMKTMKSMDPEKALDAQETIDEFFRIHRAFIGLMDQSRNYSLNKVKVPTALGPLVKLRLGDAFRFLLGHTERHLLQIKRIRSAVA